MDRLLAGECTCSENCTMIYPPLPTGYRNPIPGYGRPMFTEAQLRNFGEDCIAANAKAPITIEQIIVLAHRIASKYRHDRDPLFVEYTFQLHTLEQFVRAVEKAHEPVL